MKECPNGEAFSAFVDPMVVFCHDAAYTPLTGWEALTKAMEKSGNFPLTDRKVVASYNAHHSWWFSEGKTVVAGKTLQAFASKEKWQGTGGMDGRRDEIELSLVTSADSIRTAIEYKLPAGSQLGQLALRMLEHTLNWFTTVFKHLDSEFVRLTQVNISEEETLILLSEEVIIMFDRFYAIRRKRMDFTVHGSHVEYMVRCIWLSMEVHMVMDEFTANGMKYNSTISAAFMRFLTKVTGGNAAAGVAGIVASLESKLKNLDNTLKEVKKEVVAAASRATSATNAAEDAKKSITKLYQANTTLKK
jgi:ribosomal protein L12E/L44/L45/RPP1/RPP2